MRGLIAINVIDKDVIYNKEHPILMYYDGKKDILEAMTGVEELKTLLLESVVSLDNYETCELRYMTYFTESDNADSEEKTDIGVFYIKDVLSVDDVTDMFMKEALVRSFGTDDISELQKTGLANKTIANGVRNILVNCGISRDIVSSLIKNIQERL